MLSFIIDNAVVFAAFSLAMLWSRVRSTRSASVTFCIGCIYMIGIVSLFGLPLWVFAETGRFVGLAWWVRPLMFACLVVIWALSGYFLGRAGFAGVGAYVLYALIFVHVGLILVAGTSMGAYDPVGLHVHIRQILQEPCQGLVSGLLVPAVVVGAFVKYRIDGPVRLV